jgi:hypothetical protein
MTYLPWVILGYIGTYAYQMEMYKVNNPWNLQTIFVIQINKIEKIL